VYSASGFRLEQTSGFRLEQKRPVDQLDEDAVVLDSFDRIGDRSAFECGFGVGVGKGSGEFQDRGIASGCDLAQSRATLSVSKAFIDRA
jgi:hypothetical protein